ncbi:hypothetical protein DMI69_15645 [Escherichia coli]|nr:hypothetical protein [Escherichia coli]
MHGGWARQIARAMRKNDASNPWRYVRAATAAEITQYGNPGSCSVKPDNNGGAVTPVDQLRKHRKLQLLQLRITTSHQHQRIAVTITHLQAWSGRKAAKFTMLSSMVMFIRMHGGLVLKIARVAPV